MLLPIIFIICLIALHLFYRWSGKAVEYFWIYNLIASIFLTTVLWQLLFVGIIKYANQKFTHEYVLEALAEKGYNFDPYADTFLVPPLVYGYRPRGGKSALYTCGAHCLENYCNGIKQRVLYPKLGVSQGVRIESFVGSCDSSKPEISSHFDDEMVVLVRKYEFGKFPDYPAKKIYIGYLNQYFDVKARVQGYYYNGNLVSYELIIDFWESNWLPFFKFTYSGNEKLVRRSGWPEFIQVGK